MSGDHAVRWERLELHGFGRHVALEVDLGAGLTTLVAPNEFGKSTLVAGLTATVFGLPHVSDATKFGRERFRNWGNPSRFEGTVGFVARDGETYELHRNFESHEVRLVHRTATGAEEVFEGAHNPIARTGTDAFEEHLERLLGLKDREAFRQSFHVGQPLPAPEALGEEVQRLLSGSGQGTFQSGLERLSEQIAERTSATGDLGVSSRNLRKDRRLEQLDQEIAELDRSLSEGRDAADRAKEVGEKLDELQAERARWMAEEKEQAEVERAARSWIDARDAHDREAKDHLDLKRALANARDLADRIDAASRRIEAEWPELRDAGEGLEAKIVAARRAEAELSSAEEAVAAARAAFEEQSETAAEAQAELEAHRAAAPDEPPAHDAEDLRGLRDEAAQAQRDWERYRSRAADIARREGELRRYEAIEAADAQTIDLLRNYRWELDRRQRDVDAERRAASDAHAEHEARAAARAAQERAAAERAGARGVGRKLVVALVLAVAAAGVVLAVTQRAAFALAAAVVAGGIGFVAAPARSRGGVERRRPDTSDGATDVSPTTGAPHADRTSRGTIAPKPSDAPPAAGAPHPTGTPGPGHEGEAITAQHELDTFLEATRPFVESFEAHEDPSRAVRDWEDAKRTLAEERRLQQEHVERVWGVPPDRLEAAVPATLAGTWGNLARYAETRGASPDSLEALAGWMAARDADVWESEIAAVEDAREARRAWHATDVRLDREAVAAETRKANAEGALERATAARDRARAEEAAARAEIEGLMPGPDASAERLLERWEAYREAVRDRDALAGNLAALLKGRDAPSVEALEEAEYRAGMRVMQIATRVDELREAHPELPPLDAERESVASRLREAERKRSAAADALERVKDEIFEQTRTQSELAGTDLVNIAQVEIELRDLREERGRVQAEIEALTIAFRELQAAVSTFQANYRERLERSASGYVQTFSGVAARRVTLGEGFEVGVVEPDGTRVHPGQLSQGAQDQLLLALRLAIADHLSADAPLPLILDDPFLNWDDRRLMQVEGALRELARERQVILLSHREGFAAWGERVEIDAASED